MPGLFGETDFAEGSEDCLYLNIFRPSGAEDLPILFFSHGGGLSSGAASLDVYMDDPLLAEDAILVTYQYRLGPLGFMAHPDLDAEDPDGSSGNYGFFDALMALQFVADNAGALGGDPAKLMVFGESAGGQMTHGLLASPLASGLFSSALIQSAPGAQVGTPHEPESAFGEEVQTLLSCEDLACMRAKTPTELVEAAPASAGLDTSGHRRRDGYRRRFADHRALLEKLALRHHAHFMELGTEQPPGPTLAQGLLPRRERRRRSA